MDEYKEIKSNPEVVVPFMQVNALLGVTLTPAEMQNILLRIGAEIKLVTPESITVVGPFERTDLLIAEDFIEEIGRIHGLDKILSVQPSPLPVSEVNPRQFYSEAIRQELLQAGFSEVITSSFTNKAEIQLQNALAADKTYLRNSLSKNITKVLDQNFVHCDLLDIPHVRAFEIGTVFDKTDDSVSEHLSLVLGVRTKGNGYHKNDDAILDTACATVEQVLNTTLTWERASGVAEANLSEVLPTLDVPLAYQALEARIAATYRPVSAYPAMSRDIALWVHEGTLAPQVEAVIAGAAGDLVVRLSLFDSFTKDERTSYGFRLVFQSFERTLTDVEVNAQMESVYEAVKENDWEAR